MNLRAKTTNVQVRTRPVTNALTVDVEDYFQVQAFADRIDTSDWDTFPGRVVENTHRLLSLFDDYDATATFFILGWTANRYPQLVRDIQAAGHEIGCHSYWHQLIYTLSPSEFRDDLRRATETISNITGEAVVSYRAPSFSITDDSMWALDILVEEGYKYDSSIFPVHHDTYGIPGAERFPHVIERESGSISEFPLSVHRIQGHNLAVAGGGYFRLLPTRLSLRWLKHINRQDQQPFVFYIHPWELDPHQPRLPAKFRARFRHYQNLGRTEAKLRRLLKHFQFSSMSSVMANQLPPETGTAVDDLPLEATQPIPLAH